MQKHIIFKKQICFMGCILFSLCIADVSYPGQYDLRFSDAQQNGGFYDVTVEIRSPDAGESFSIGTGSITFDYNPAMLSAPVLAAAYHCSGFDMGPPTTHYSDMTVTMPANGTVSLNIELKSVAQVVNENWLALAKIKFTLNSSGQCADFSFRSPAGVMPCVITDEFWEDIPRNSAQNLPACPPVPTVNWSATYQSIVEHAGTVAFTAILSIATDAEVTVPYTVGGTAQGNGTDHDLSEGAIFIPAGEKSGTATFDVSDDSLHESDETIIINMGTPVNADKGISSVLTITLADNDPLPGDVDKNETVVLSDAVIALRIVNGLDPGTNVNRAADVNTDGKIGMEEAVYVLKKTAETGP
jgi:hypothetical protein